MSKKIIITGCTCAGKTTLGAKMSKKLLLPQVDLDEHHFLPNWEERTKEDFLASVDAELAGKEGWVVSGNYNTLVKDTLWKQAHTIVWLDYPLGLVLHRYFLRTFRRVVFREPCCGGNYETLSRTFSKDSLFLWIFKSYWRRRKRMLHWRQELFSQKEWVVLAHPRETTLYLEQL